MRAVPFAVGSLEVTGNPVPLVEGVSVKGSGAANFAVSDNGRFVYALGTAVFSTEARSLAWVDRDGAAEAIETIPANTFDGPRLSPDGSRLLVRANGDLRIYELDNGCESRVTTDGQAGNYGEWHPNGSEVVYTRDEGTDSTVWRRPADGSGVGRQLVQLDGGVHVDAWSPDGETLAIHHHVGPAGADLLVLPLDGSDLTPQGFLEREFRDIAGTFSPDGHYVAYVSDESGQLEVYIRSFPEPGGQRPLSVGGGAEPLWAPNGELFYIRPSDAMMMAVTVATDPTLTIGSPTELFQRAPCLGAQRRRYDVTADGQRFLLLTNQLRLGDGDSGGSDQAPAQEAREITVVLNWFEELHQRVPIP